MDAAAVLIKTVKEKAEQSVDYSPKYGALCPECGSRMAVETTRPWEDDSRVRYHRCVNTDVCIIAKLGLNIKSIQMV